jgi:phage terminase small subunit
MASHKPAGATLNLRQQRFVAEYVIDLNGTAAAIRAGYSPRTANEQAARLLAHASVSSAVQEAQRARLAARGLTAERVLEEYRRVALLDHRSFFDAEGNLKPVSAWTDEQGSAVSSSEVIIKNAAAGDGKTDRIHKLKTWDKVRALEGLAKHFGLLIEKQQVTGTLRVVWDDGD